MLSPFGKTVLVEWEEVQGEGVKVGYRRERERERERDGASVQQELAQAGDVLTVFFAILIGAFVIGQAGPNLQKLVQAQAAAGAIYEIIDRVSPC